MLLLALINLSCGNGSKTGKFEDPYENKDDISAIRDKNQKNWYYIKSNNQEILEKLNLKKNKNTDLISVLTKEDSLYLKEEDIFFKNSFEKPIKINEYKRIFFHHFFLEKETITYGTFFYKGSICKDVYLSRKTENSYYLFFIFFLVFPLCIYIVNNNIKIGKRDFYLDIKEGSNFNKLMILFFGIGILSSKSEYIFNYFKNELFNYISWIFDSKSVFSFLFLSLLLIMIHYLFNLILFLIGFEKKFPKRIPISIVIFTSLMYCLFVGIYTGELYFYNIYEIFLSFIMFRVIFGIMFIPKMYKHIA